MLSNRSTSPASCTNTTIHGASWTIKSASRLPKSLITILRTPYGPQIFDLDYKVIRNHFLHIIFSLRYWLVSTSPQLIVLHNAILTACSPPICPQTCYIHVLIQLPDISDNQTCVPICLSSSSSSLHLLYPLFGHSTLCT
jgi:hypothetical protein